jgi:hypothetical protein
MNKICIFLAITWMSISVAFAADFGREPRPSKPVYNSAVDVTTAHGCYFHRGRRFCNRYCYIERNGYRYCQPRARDAYPQADLWIEEVYPRRSHW